MTQRARSDSSGEAPRGPHRVVVMGVAGSGKTTVGEALADRLATTFIDADQLHPAANVAKMTAGQPLDDSDRWPWLAAVRQALRGSEGAVIACSALTRRYRDMLRGAGGVTFVHLDIDRETARMRATSRQGHFMGAGMVDSQFALLEPPMPDETDIVIVSSTGHLDDVIDAAVHGLDVTRPGAAVSPFSSDGGVDREISDPELAAHVAALVAEIRGRGYRRVLLVPPDQTRLHSRAGLITVLLRDELLQSGCDVGVLPALGTHAAMNDDDATALFGGRIAATDLMVHDWRHGLRHLGTISADEVGVVTEGRYHEAIDVAIDDQIFDGWELIVSVGQVVPHEVIGMANFTKNLVIGLGGAPTIHRTHFVGAAAGMESIMGRATSAVRDVVDAAFDRFVAPLVSVLWVLTVVEDVGGAMTLRGLFVGEGGSGASGGAAFQAAAALAQRTNIEVVDPPFSRVACWLDPTEFHSTWLGNKAVYRTRMAIADGGELIVLAPGVRRFGEDEHIDLLIRRHGYRDTPGTLAAISDDPELAANLGAAAHLIHGSSEGRFRIVYCTDPDAGGLTRNEIESVGYTWRSLRVELDSLAIGPSTPSGPRADLDGRPFHFVANPAMGLWSTTDRFSH